MFKTTQQTVTLDHEPFVNYDYKGQEAYVHEWADGHISLSTRHGDYLVGPCLLEPYSRIETVQVHVEDRVTVRHKPEHVRVFDKQRGHYVMQLDSKQGEAEAVTEPVFRNERVDTTPLPTVIGRPVNIGDNVTITFVGTVLDKGELLELSQHFVRVGNRRYYFTNNHVVSRS